MGFFQWLYGTGKEGIVPSSTPGLPHIEVLDPALFGENQYRLVDEFVYDWQIPVGENEYSRRQIVVPKNFIYDGASVPSCITRLTGIKRDGEHRAAALLHDWIYHHKGRLPGEYYRIDFSGESDATWLTWPRKDADRMFGRVMREFGYTRWKRMWTYRAVRWFGWLLWYDMVRAVQLVLAGLTVFVFGALAIPVYFAFDLLSKMLREETK